MVRIIESAFFDSSFDLYDSQVDGIVFEKEPLLSLMSAEPLEIRRRISKPKPSIPLLKVRCLADLGDNCMEES